MRSPSELLGVTVSRVSEEYSKAKLYKIATVANAPRGTGKTASVKAILRQNPDTVAVVPELHHVRTIYREPEFRNRVFTPRNFYDETRGRKVEHVIIDEGLGRFVDGEMLKLVYSLGVHGIPMTAVGSYGSGYE